MNYKKNYKIKYLYLLVQHFHKSVWLYELVGSCVVLVFIFCFSLRFKEYCISHYLIYNLIYLNFEFDLIPYSLNLKLINLYLFVSVM